jgi:hypothetical protein
MHKKARSAGPSRLLSRLGMPQTNPTAEQYKEKQVGELAERMTTITGIEYEVTAPKPVTTAKIGHTLPEGHLRSRWLDILHDPCPFQPGKLVEDTHFLFSGTAAIEHYNDQECLDSHCPISLASLLQSNSDAFATSYNQRFLGRGGFVTAEANVRDIYLMYAGEICEEEPTSFDDQLALLPESYRSARAVETVLMLLAYRRQHGRFLPGDFRWGWCSDSLTPAKQTHVAVSIAGCSSIAFDEFPNQRIRSNRYIVALRKQL